MAQQTAINAATPSTEQAEAKPRRNPVPIIVVAVLAVVGIVHAGCMSALAYYLQLGR